MPLSRSELVLAALAAGGQNLHYEPVQVQKLLFLIDREAQDYIDGARFDFRPYDYGPFDREVYSELDALSVEGLVRIEPRSSRRVYSLTAEGHQAGQRHLADVQEPARNYFERAATWVRSLSFSQLVSAIYRQYPDMAVNSIFR